MSILIKSIEMPRNDEMLFLKIYPNGKVTIDGDLECKQIATAVPVPPHGRLIDADAYEELLRGLGNRDYRREKGTICDAVKFLHPQYTPTVIDAEAEGDTKNEIDGR